MLWDILVITQMLVLIITTTLKMEWIMMKHSSLFEIMSNGPNSRLSSGSETKRGLPSIFYSQFEQWHLGWRLWFPIKVNMILGFIHKELVLDWKNGNTGTSLTVRHFLILNQKSIFLIILESIFFFIPETIYFILTYILYSEAYEIVR